MQEFMVTCHVLNHKEQLVKEKHALEADLAYEKWLKEQELLKRDKEHKKELESVRKELEAKIPSSQEV